MQTFTRFTITGVVQGVGFRPFIYSACTNAGLCGHVQNVGNGVVAVVNDATAFRRILASIPPHIRIDTIREEKINECATDFTIKKSAGNGFAETPPDFFLCDHCLSELADPSNRRYGYFFITCTQCGPRFTITHGNPYDRDTTTMSSFEMCPACRQEYEDPKNRRFHAQTIACHDCGPKLTLYRDGSPFVGMHSPDIFQTIAIALERGEVIAVKGVGGFHLMCSAREESIKKLNHFTHRTGKPYALLCRDIEMAETISTITLKEKDLLMSVERPIVLVQKKGTTPPASELDSIGIMLAYTALHILLFEHYKKPLICTSSNAIDAPITITQEAQSVPLVLDHDRTIYNAADDSVMKVVCGAPLLIRRSRGFVPRSIPIPSRNTAPILALGAEMNSTFALSDGNGRVILSPHFGNTAHPDAFKRYEESIHRFLTMTRIIPQAILCDAHPAYRTSIFGTKLAKQLGIPLIPIQHHRAHAAGVALEHGLNDYVAIVCDGLGYGDDGTLWGGEIFENSERIGHLETYPQLGGDSAARYPHKMLYAILRSFLDPEKIEPFMENRFARSELTLLERQYTERFNAPLTSSCGRVLDAAAALLGICDERTYDGRPAMLLESHSSHPFTLAPVIDGSILRTAPLFSYLIKHLGEDTHRLAATVEQYLAEGLYTIAAQKKKPIVWAGGCAYNRNMTTYFLERGVLINHDVPTGDGGISFGQIASYLTDTRNNISRWH